ncbi:calcium-binding protein [Candidatus Parcubacteria bacterium]|nr:MAG: calcium-binding protein [Candidatus Parcubacteria bacterium]
MTRTRTFSFSVAAATIIACSLLFAFSNTQIVSAASTLFDDASIVGGGNPGNAVQIRSDASVLPGFGGVRFDDAVGLLFPSLTTLSADFNVTDDSCGGGSPRIQIQIDTDGDTVSNGNIFVYLGPSPSFTGCTTGWQNTGNLIGNADAGRWDFTQLGGPLGTYASAPANVLAGTIRNISIVDDSSWSAAATGGDSEMTTLIDNVVINSTTYEFPPAPPVTVSIAKYVDGVHATTLNAEGLSFPMQSSWDADNIGAGSGSFSLAPATYEAQTASMSSGADYSTNEVLSGASVGESCAEGKPFALVGYSTGDSFASAATSTATTTSPALTNITNDAYIIVWNKDCTPKITVTKFVINDNGGTATTSDFALFIDNATTTSGVATTTTAGTHIVSETNMAGYTATIGGDCDVLGNVVLAAGDNKTCTITNNDIAITAPGVKVTIVKYVGGQHATSLNASSTSFPMASNWDATNLGGAGNGTYNLSTTGFNTLNAYEAVTSDMSSGSDYATNEDTSTSVVGPNCANGQQFMLSGYSTGDTLAQAQLNATTTGSPSFTDITTDKYVIVWNEPCSSTPPTPPGPPTNACATPMIAPAGYTLQNGTPGNNNVTLAPNTMFVGKGGNDKVSGPNGNYIICLGNGNDKVTLGNGDSTIDAGGGNNKVEVGNGDTTIIAGNGNDKVTTGNGDYAIDADGGNNAIETGDGNGTITTGNGNDKITTKDGDHTVDAGGGNNTVQTGDGTQNITTGAGNDKITTGSGNDTVNAGGGNNNVSTDGGNDSITAGNGNDKFNAGAGASDSCSAGGGNNTVLNCEM